MYEFTTAPDIRGHREQVAAFKADEMKADLPGNYVVYSHFYNPRRPDVIDGEIYAPHVGTIIYPTMIELPVGGRCYHVLAKHRYQRTYFNGDYDVTSNILCVETLKTPRFRTIRHVLTFRPETKDLRFVKTRKLKHDQPPSARAAAFRRKVRIKHAPPSWCDTREIEALKRRVRALNKEAGFTKFHLDHDPPLQGDNVCGLNIPENLKIMLASDNIRKSNKWETENGR